MTAYFVTTHYSLYGHIGGENLRIVGFFPNLDDAVRIVEDNVGDINENGYYKHATIEMVESGLYPNNHGYDRQTRFYEWNTDQRKYVRIDRRPEWEHFGNFSGVG